MDENNYARNKKIEDHKNYNSPGFPNSRQPGNNNTGDNERVRTEKSLRNKLDHAFSDLESLRNTLKDIKSKNDNIPPQNKQSLNQNFTKKEDFLSSGKQIFNINTYKPENISGNGNSPFNSRKRSSSKRSKSKNINQDSLGTPRNGNRTYLTVYDENKINTQALFSNLQENMKESEKILSINPKNQKFHNTILSPTKSIMSINKKITDNDLNFYNSMNSNQTDYLNINNDLNFSNNIINRTNFKDNLNKSSTKNLNKSNLIYENPKINEFSKASHNALKDENDRLKLSIQVLNKSNLDLKNQMRILQIELNANNNNNFNSFSNSLSNDPQVFNYVENLKSSLSSLQHSNMELTNIFETLQKKNSETNKENLILKEQYELASRELESLTKKFCDTRNSLDEITSELRKLEKEKSIMGIHKNDLEGKYKLAEEKSNNLLSINESNLKCKNDNLEMIENLKNTVENMRRVNGESDKEKYSLETRLGEIEAILKEKNYSIENMSNKIKNFENDREYYNQELKILEKELKDKDKFIETLQDKYHELNTEYEKSKSKNEALLINIDERDQTIENFKTSINFMSNTIEDYKSDYDKVKSQNDGDFVDKNRLGKELELTQKKLNDIIFQYDLLIKDKESLQKKNIEIENELNEKKNNLKKFSFENEVLLQKLENNTGLIEKLQENTRNVKISKINEDFQQEITKSNEDRIRRVKEIEKQINLKNNTIEELNQQIHNINLIKDEKINELQHIINKKTISEQEMELRMNDYVNQLKNEIDNSKNEIFLFKSEKENEIKSIMFKYNTLKSDYDALMAKYKFIENNYVNDKNTLNNNFIFPNPVNGTNVKNKNIYEKNIDLPYKTDDLNLDLILNKVKEINHGGVNNNIFAAIDKKYNMNSTYGSNNQNILNNNIKNNVQQNNIPNLENKNNLQVNNNDNFPQNNFNYINKIGNNTKDNNNMKEFLDNIDKEISKMKLFNHNNPVDPNFKNNNPTNYGNKTTNNQSFTPVPNDYQKF